MIMILYSILGSLGWIPFVIIIWFMLSTRARVNKLEEEVKKLRGGVTVAEQSHAVASQVQAPAQTIINSQQEMEQTVPVVQTMPTPQESSEPSWIEYFGMWLKEDWLLKLGAFIILLGFGWFLSYAFAHGWIGEVGRVTLGIIFGVFILGFGWIRMHSYTRQGSVFLGLGSTVILISAYSAAYVYNLIPGQASLGIAFLTCAFVALASIRFKVYSLAVSSVLIASIAPSVLLSGATPSYVEIFAYLFAVTLGTIWIVAITGWRNLTVVSLIMFFLYSIPQLVTTNVETGTLLIFAYVFALIFFTVNTIGILKIRDGDINTDTAIAGANGLLLLAWISIHAAQEWKTFIIVGSMMLFIVVAFIIFAITKRKEPFFIYSGVGIAMLATATAINFHGGWLTIAYTIEGAIIPVIVYLITNDKHMAKKLLMLMFGSLFLSTQSIVANWYTSIPWNHFFILLIVSATLFFLGIFFASLHEEGEENNIAPTLFIGGSIYAYILLWLSLHAGLDDKSIATTICLVIYTVIGLISYAYGRVKDNKSFHHYGGILLAVTVGRLLLVDFWSMPLSGKIVTAFIVGALLMGTAFISKKKN